MIASNKLTSQSEASDLLATVNVTEQMKMSFRAEGNNTPTEKVVGENRLQCEFIVPRCDRLQDIS